MTFSCVCPGPHTRAFARTRITVSELLVFLLVQEELDLILRRDAKSVEAIYLSRNAAVSAAASLSAASLLDKTPRVALKIAEPLS